MPVAEPSKPPCSAVELLARRAAATPSEPLCYRRGRRWQAITCQEVWRQVERVADVLRGLQLEPGSRIAIVARTSYEWFVAEMASLAAGAVVVGIEPHAGNGHLQHLLCDSGASYLFVQDQPTLDRIPEKLRGGLRAVIVFDGEAECANGEAVLHWRSISDDSLIGGTPAPELSWNPPGRVDSGGALPDISLDDPATMIYTSGTTGEPKAIVYSHRQLAAAYHSIIDAFPQLSEGDATLCWLPMAHLFQRMMNLVAVAKGGRMYFVNDPRDVIRAAGEVAPAVFFGVPRFYEKLFEGIQQQLSQLHGWRRRLVNAAFDSARKMRQHRVTGTTPPTARRWRHQVLDMLVMRQIRRVVGANVKFMITGSAPIAGPLLRFFDDIGLLVLEAYGISENTIPMAANRPNDYRFGSVGKPMGGNHIRLADDGEILVKGPGVFAGYRGEAAVAERFTEDGYYRTGDIGRWDEDGFLYLVDRKSEIIKTTNGRRLSPARIESTYLQSPLFDHLIVIGHGRKFLTALIRVNHGCLLQRLGGAACEIPLSQQAFERSSTIRDIVEAELGEYGTLLAHYERIAGFALLPEPLSIERAELTPTLKVRRRRVQTLYAELIDALYETRAAGIPASVVGAVPPIAPELAQP